MTHADHGRVVILNGTASAGKTTLAREIRRLASSLWIIVSQDDFAQNLLPRWVTVDGAFAGERGEEGFHFVRDDGGLLHVDAGPVGRQLLRGYRFAAAACARAGNDVVVDECKFDEEGWTDWQEALSGLDPTWVRVECSLGVCARREQARDDRRAIIGLARGQYERVHTGVAYDLVVDLSDDDVEKAVEVVLAAVTDQSA